MILESEELIEKLEATKNKLWKVEKKLGAFLVSLGVSIAEYALMVYIMYLVYNHFGWNYTLIALGCGVILFGLRIRVGDATKDAEIKRLRIELAKRGG